MKTPINAGLLQSDLDCAGFDLLNFSGGGGGTGHGIPAGGLAGQSLTKIDATDYNAHWSTVTGGGGGTGLDANTVTAADIGLVGDGVTDNTTALQAWLNDVEAAKVNSTLLVPDGVYIFSGALQDTGRRNAQILLPICAITDRQYAITIKGYHPIACSPSGPLSIVTPRGPIFRSTLATGGGPLPSFIGGRGPVGGSYNETNYLHLCLENMIFQTVQNPSISCVNLYSITSVDLSGDILIMAGQTMATVDMVQPTINGSYGLLLPRDSSGILQKVEHANIFNFYTGCWVGELSHIENIGCWSCYYTLEFGFSYHITLIERFLDFWSPNGIRVTGVHPFQIQQFAVERSEAGHWYTRVYDIVDPSNLAIADIAWWTVTAFIGAENTFTINGGTGVKARRIGNDITGSPIYVGTDARLVAVTGGTKLQVRNPGTGLWADGDQWTNP